MSRMPIVGGNNPDDTTAVLLALEVAVLLLHRDSQRPLIFIFFVKPPLFQRPRRKTPRRAHPTTAPSVRRLRLGRTH